jgi:membrane protease YdiL (CAAX protease family)
VVMDVPRIARLVGLAAGTAALVGWVWSMRRFPIVERRAAFRRELAPSAGPRGATFVCAVAGLLAVFLPVAWSLVSGTAHLAIDRRWIAGSVVAFLATIVVKLALVVSEEAIYRTAFVRTIASVLGRPGALLCGAVAFALAHGRDAMSAAILTADGIGFGVAYLVTRSLRAPVAWHAAKNLAVWLLVGESTIQFARGPARLTSESNAPPGDAPELVITLAVVAVTTAWLLRRRAGPRAESRRPASPTGADP